MTEIKKYSKWKNPWNYVSWGMVLPAIVSFALAFSVVNNHRTKPLTKPKEVVAQENGREIIGKIESELEMLRQNRNFNNSPELEEVVKKLYSGEKRARELINARTEIEAYNQDLEQTSAVQKYRQQYEKISFNANKLGGGVLGFLASSLLCSTFLSKSKDYKINKSILYRKGSSEI